MAQENRETVVYNSFIRQAQDPPLHSRTPSGAFTNPLLRQGGGADACCAAYEAMSSAPAPSDIVKEAANEDSKASVEVIGDAEL